MLNNKVGIERFEVINEVLMKIKYEVMDVRKEFG
jgi:hypothetical protein